MVMNKGQIVEFDTPLTLLDNPKSKLSLMISQTGDVDVVQLRRMAQKRSKMDEPSRSSSQTSVHLERQSSMQIERRHSSIQMERQTSVPSSLRDIYLNPSDSNSNNNLRSDSTPNLSRSDSTSP